MGVEVGREIHPDIAQALLDNSSYDVKIAGGGTLEITMRNGWILTVLAEDARLFFSLRQKQMF